MAMPCPGAQMVAMRSIFGAALLLLALLTNSAEAENATDYIKDNSVAKKPATKNGQELTCPPTSVSLPIFALPCKSDKDCEILSQLCCDVDGKQRCRKGVPKPTPKPTHTPAFFGLIPRECPTNPIIEMLPVKNCTNDTECWPRICCPDGRYSYCRTPMPEWEEPTTGFAPIRNILPYLQCTPPPPALFDLFPKPCRTPIDCFPNLCCQEKGKKICRPPRKSILPLVATIGQAITQRTRRFGIQGSSKTNTQPKP